MNRIETRVVLGSVAATGLVLGFDIGGPLQGIVGLWFLLACPGLAITGVFQIPEKLPRWVLVIAISITVDILVAEAMIYAGRWSRADGFYVITLITLAGLALSLYVTRPVRSIADYANERRLAVEDLFQP